MMALILFSSVLLFCLSYFVQGQTVKSVEICLTLGLPLLKVNYNCESQEMIHVISVLHQEASPSCDPVPGGCQVLLESSSDGLTIDCNGHETCTSEVSAFRLRQRCENINESLTTVSYECIRDFVTNLQDKSTVGLTCTEDVTLYALNKTCDFNITIYLVTVSNEWVKDSPIHMCSTTYAVTTTTVYLTSPSFPLGTGNGLILSNDSCVCNITGTDMSVEILEIYFLVDPSVRANLTLEGDKDFWDSSTAFLMFNTLVIARTSHIKLMYDEKGTTGQDAWIRIKGLGSVTVDCNPMQTTTTSPATTPTTTRAVRQSNDVVTDLTSTSSVHVDTTTPTVDLVKLGDSNTPAIIGVLCGVIAILILAVAALVVYIKCVKPRRLLKSASASPETTDGNYDHNTQDQIANPTQPTLNDQDPSDRTNADYADMTQYINLDNVYTGLGPQEDNPEHLPSPDNTYSHPHIYSNVENSHEYSQLSHEQKLN